MNLMGRIDPDVFRASPQRPPPEVVRLMVVAIIAMTVFDFLAPGFLIELADTYVGQDFLWTTVLGVIAGQLLMAAVCAVLGASRFWRRWLGSLAVVFVAYAAFVAGMIVDGVSSSARQLHAVNSLFVPLVFLSAQFPLWLLRLGLGRGLNLEDHRENGRSGAIQFGIRELLTAFVLIGGSLAAARLAVLLDDLRGRAADDLSPWLSLALACAMFGVWSALAVVPCVWAAFLAPNRRLATFGVLACVSFAVFGAAAALSTIFNLQGKDAQQFWLTGMAFHGGLLAVVLLGCHVLRNAGYTLRRDQALARRT